MASRKLTDLTPNVKEKAEFVINYCKERGVEILIYCTLRTLQEQAILYRSSRKSGTIVQAKIQKLKDRDLGFLAEIIEKVGAQAYNGWKTNAAPGESYHAYKEAFDAVPLLGGKAIWDYNRYPEGWAIYGEAVRAAGMCWGGDWLRHTDFPHAQLRQGSNPLKFNSPDKIKRILTENKLLSN